MVSSPLRRARESADIVSERLGAPYSLVEGLTEASFGTWEGLTYAEVAERDPDAFAAWFGDVDRPAGGSGDSLSGDGRADGGDAGAAPRPTTRGGSSWR